MRKLELAAAPTLRVKDTYSKIDESWLAIHFKVTAYLTLIIFLLEALVSVYIIQTDLLKTSLPVYFLKYLLIPSLCNFSLLFLGTWIMRSARFSQKQRIYSISLILLLICFVLTTVHNIYTPIYAVYLVPILLAGVYADHQLTKMLGGTSLALFFLSEFVISWDKSKQSALTNPLRLVGIVVLFLLIGISSVLCILSVNYIQNKYAESLNLELERHQLEQQLQFDELTGVYNRLGLKRALAAVTEDFEHTYVFAITDLDHFKKINDHLGHAAGDLLLQGFADILKATEEIQGSFRFGGDEFCLLFQDYSPLEVVAVCHKIQLDLARFIQLEFPEHPATASFGLAQYQKGMTVQELLTRADEALYQAKEQRNQVIVFSEQA